MPDYLHRTTFVYLKSVASAELPEALVNYVEYPDLSPVNGVPSKYWVLTGDVLSEMDQAAKETVDAAADQDIEDGEIFELDAGILKRFVLVMLDEINRIRTAEGINTVTIAQLKNAMRDK